MDTASPPPKPRQGRPEFHDLREQVMGLFAQRRHEDALEAARDLQARYPERGEIPFWMACALGSLARPDEALKVLGQALDAGLWWPTEWLREDDDLALLRGRPELDVLVERCEQAQQSWEMSFEPRPIILAPPSHPSPSSTLSGAVIALHGWGGNALDFVDPWRPVLEEGLLLAVPESSQVLSPLFHVWDDPSHTAKDLALAYKRLQATCTLDEQRLVAAGFSQGGGIGVSSVLRGKPLPADAFFVVGTGLSDIDATDLDSLDGPRTRAIRGWMLIGENDEALPDAVRLHTELRSRGITCQLEVVSDLAHSMPHDLASRLRRALATLLPREEAGSRELATD